MTLVTAKGRTYNAMFVGVFVLLWRAACTSEERREWPNGLVFRAVHVPHTEQPELGCSCPAARYQRGGAMDCPHALSALHWLAAGGAMRVQGGISPFAGVASATVSPRSVRGDVTGLSPNSVTLSYDTDSHDHVTEELSPWINALTPGDFTTQEMLVAGWSRVKEEGLE